MVKGMHKYHRMLHSFEGRLVAKDTTQDDMKLVHLWSKEPQRMLHSFDEYLDSYLMHLCANAEQRIFA